MNAKGDIRPEGRADRIPVPADPAMEILPMAVTDPLASTALLAVSAVIPAHAPAAVLPLEPPQNNNRQNCKNRTKNAEKPPK